MDDIVRTLEYKLWTVRAFAEVNVFRISSPEESAKIPSIVEMVWWVPRLLAFRPVSSVTGVPAIVSGTRTRDSSRLVGFQF